MSSDSGARRGHRLAAPLLVVGVGACILVLLIAVAGLAGGLDEVAYDDVPRAEVEELVEGEPWNVTVVGAGLFRELPRAILDDEDNHWLLVIAEVEITADASQGRGDVEEILQVSGLDGLRDDPVRELPAPDEMFLARDTTRLAALHPGLPERVAFLWERSSDAPPPAEIEITIIGMTYRESTLSGHMEWLDPEPHTRLTVPLRDRRDDDGDDGDGDDGDGSDGDAADAGDGDE